MENFSSPKIPPTRGTPAPESFSPNTILLRAFRFTIHRKDAWVFGFFLSLPTITLLLLSKSISFAEKITSGTFSSTTLFLFLFLSLFFFLVGESGLVLCYDPSKHPASILSRIAALGALGRWYFFFFLILLSLFSILFLPSVVFPGPEGSLDILRILGIVFFLPLLALLFLIKNFGVFYLLLSHLNLKDSALQSYELFLKEKSFSFLSLLFILIVTALFFLFSRIMFDIIPSPLSLAPLPLLACFGYIALSFFGSIFIQSLWYFSFEKIAGNHPQDWQKEKEMVQKEMASVGEV